MHNTYSTLTAALLIRSITDLIIPRRIAHLRLKPFKNQRWSEGQLEVLQATMSLWLLRLKPQIARRPLSLIRPIQQITITMSVGFRFAVSVHAVLGGRNSHRSRCKWRASRSLYSTGCGNRSSHDVICDKRSHNVCLVLVFPWCANICGYDVATRSQVEVGC